MVTKKKMLKKVLEEPPVPLSGPGTLEDPYPPEPPWPPEPPDVPPGWGLPGEPPEGPELPDGPPGWGTFPPGWPPPDDLPDPGAIPEPPTPPEIPELDFSVDINPKYRIIRPGGRAIFEIKIIPGENFVGDRDVHIEFVPDNFELQSYSNISLSRNILRRRSDRATLDIRTTPFIPLGRYIFFVIGRTWFRHGLYLVRGMGELIVTKSIIPRLPGPETSNTQIKKQKPKKRTTT